MSPFNISACTANYGRADLFGVIDRLAALGYDGAEITVMYHAVPAETDAARRRAIARHLHDADLVASALHFIFPSGLSMVAAEKNDRALVGAHVGAVLDLAADLGAGVVVVGGGGMRVVPKDTERRVAVDRVVEVFGDIAYHAERAGVTACFEALNRYETQIGRTLGECAEYVDRIGSPRLGIAGDIFHMNIEESSLTGAIEQIGDRLKHLHIPDSHRMAPGGGHVDFASILRVLRSTGFEGFLSPEIFWIAPDIPYLDSWEACDREVAQAIRHIRTVEASL